jgi:hypothetical protein
MATGERRAMRGYVLFALMVLALTGCYTYVPVDVAAAPEPGAKVRVHLTEQATADLTPEFGPGVQRFDGYLIQLRPDSMLMQVEWAQSAVTGRFLWNGGPVRLPQAQIASLESWTLARTRSALLVAGGAILIYVVSRALGIGDSGAGPDPIDPDPDPDPD